MEEGLPPKLAQLRAKLGLKAKQEPNFRFYTLYSHIFRMDILEVAWKQVLQNGGACGYDGITLEDVKMIGVHEFFRRNT
jgi:RNA-directed DNA polymerase